MAPPRTFHDVRNNGVMPESRGRDVNPSESDHIPRRQAPGEGAQNDRELTEYQEPPGERDKPGAREQEREGKS